MQTAADLTEDLQNITPTSLIPHLGDKQTAALRQLESIFNVALSYLTHIPLLPLPAVEQTPSPLPRSVPTQQTTTPAFLYPFPAPRPRVSTWVPITITPCHAVGQPPQKAPCVIPDDTKPIPPSKNQYDGNPIHIPPVHRYNTRARRLKVHDIMENHITTI